MRRHIAKIKNIWPLECDEKKALSENAYCGLSISNPNFYGQRLQAVINFIAANFNKCLLITTGYVYRHHYLLFNSNIQEALNLAEEKEKIYFENELMPVLTNLVTECEINVLSWRELFFQEGFKNSIEEVIIFYEEESDFRQRINSVAESFVISKIKSNAHNLFWSKEKAIDLSINFLLEEAAIFNYLSEKGYKTDIYPGISLPALRDVLKYDRAPIGLKQRSVIELSVLRRGRKNKEMESKKQLDFVD